LLVTAVPTGTSIVATAPAGAVSTSWAPPASLSSIVGVTGIVQAAAPVTVSVIVVKREPAAPSVRPCASSTSDSRQAPAAVPPTSVGDGLTVGAGVAVVPGLGAGVAQAATTSATAIAEGRARRANDRMLFMPS
jgi:hypothetical protein